MRRGRRAVESRDEVLRTARDDAQELEWSFRLFKEMREQGTVPNGVTCSALMDACLKADDIDLAFAVLEHMLDVGIEPTEVRFFSTGDVRQTPVPGVSEWLWSASPAYRPGDGPCCRSHRGKFTWGSRATVPRSLNALSSRGLARCRG